MAGNSSPQPPGSPRATRPDAAQPSPARPNRLALRLIGVPLLAVAGVLIYRGLHDRFVLPECDLGRAKDALADILKQLKYQPLRYEPIKTISSSKDEVVCNALLPLADGANLNVDYSFFWQGHNAEMKYSLSRRPAQRSGID